MCRFVSNFFNALLHPTDCPLVFRFVRRRQSKLHECRDLNDDCGRSIWKLLSLIQQPVLIQVILHLIVCVLRVGVCRDQNITLNELNGAKTTAGHTHTDDTCL